jgi:hypothetical protein
MRGERLPGAFAAAEPATYGQYLGMLARLFSGDSFALLKDLLEHQHTAAEKLETATRIELISEKHGVLYSVARLLIHFGDDVRSFAVNCAFSEEQQAFLQVEAKLLSFLHAGFDLPYLPAPFISAGAAGIRVLIVEWFENHHEFHLSLNSSGVPCARLWKQGSEPQFLSESKTSQLYAQASKILTSYLDGRSFSQIYPWHHGAGDFIMNDSQDPVSVRLITVRGYRPLLAKKSDCRDKILGSLHFFVNLTIRMRIDRLDGTGDLAWAGSQCLPDVICGFAEAWETKRQNTNFLPAAGEIFSLFLNLSPDERLSFTEIAAADGRVEADEGDFLLARLPGHVVEVSGALENFEKLSKH